MINKTYGKILGLGLMAVSAIAPAQVPEWGGVDDVPTWQAGDTWPMRRTFGIDVDALFEVTEGLVVQIIATLNFNDTYTLRVDPTTPIADVTPSIGGYTEKAYIRKRTAGSVAVTGSGKIKIPAVSQTDELRLTFNLPTFNSMAAGSENWTGVSDLSLIRERFVVPPSQGTMSVTGFPNNSIFICTLAPSFGITCGGPPIAFGIGLDLAIDHWAKDDANTTTGLELIDFPTIDPNQQTPNPFPGGERWIAAGQRGLVGNITLQVPSLSVDADVPLSGITTPVNYLLQLEKKGVSDPNNRYADNQFIRGLTVPNNDLVYYSPTAKEMSYWRLGDLRVQEPTLTVTLKNFITQILNTAGVIVKPDANITNLVISPPRPSFGQSFEVRGNAGSTSGTLITATLLRPAGLSDVQTTQTLTGGAFSVRMTAPLEGDNSPNDTGSKAPEYGSFGIEIARGGSTPPHNKKLVTVRLDGPLAAKDWEEYE